MIQDTKSRLPAFTLIEILIVTSIIMVLSVIGIPAISQFGKRADFENRKYEIAALINQVALKSKNPDKGYDRYQVVIDEGAKTIQLERKRGGGAVEVVSKIQLSGGQSVVVNYFPNLYCKTPGTECGHTSPALGDQPISATAIEKFITFTDNSTSPALSSEMWIKADPFTVQAR